MAESTVSRLASCVDFNSTDEEEVASTRKVAVREANTTAKRTTDGPGSTSPPLKKHQDLASDSGYSSRTLATSASADSGQSATAPAKPGVTDMPTNSSHPQPKQVLPGSSSRRSRSLKNCTDPNCTKCELPRKKKTAASSSKPHPPPERPRSPSTKRSSEKAAPSAAAAANTSRSNPLRSASTSRRRPQSMYGGYPHPAAGAAYFTQPGYPYARNGAAYLANPAHFTAPERPGMPYRFTDPTAYSARRRPVSTAGTTPMVSYYPGATQRLSARRPTRRPSVGFVDDDDDESDEAEDEDEGDELDENTLLLEHYLTMLEENRKMENENQQIRAQLRAKNLKEKNDKSQAQSSQAAQAPQASQAPQAPQAAQTGQAAQPSASKYSMRQYDKQATRITYGTRNDYDHDGVGNTLRGMNANVLSGMPIRERRPSFVSNPDYLGASAYPQPVGNNPRMAMNDPNWPPRRMSYTDNLDELRAKRELEKLYASRMAAIHQNPTIQDKRASMNFHTPTYPELYNQLAETNQDGKPILDAKIRNVMEYIQRVDDLGHADPTPLTDKILRHHAGLSPEVDPRLTSRSNASNDGTARISAGHRIKAGPERGTFSTSGDEVKMRIDITSGLDAEINGHRVVINPTGDGSQAEVVIGGKRENTSYYGTTKDSVTTESKLDRNTSIREKAARQVERQRERDRGRDRGHDRGRDQGRERGRERGRGPERERERRDRSHQHEDDTYEDDYLSSTSSSEFPAPHRTRTKRSGTYTPGRRAAEDESETERLRKGHRRMKTIDARYSTRQSSPTRGRGRRNIVG